MLLRGGRYWGTLVDLSGGLGKIREYWGLLGFVTPL